MVGAFVKVWTADEKGYGSVAAGARVVAAWYAVHDERGAATGRTALLLLPRRAAGMRCGQFAECTATFCALTTGDECAEKRDLESVERLAGSLTCHQLARPLHATLVTSGPV